MQHISPIFSLVLALLGASGSVSAGELQDMKVLQDENGTRAVLSLQGEASYKLFTLSNPERLVLDLPQSQVPDGFKLPAPNGAIANVRTGKPAPGTLRIVFDLGSPVASRSHLEHDGPTTRLVVELTARDSAVAPASSAMIVPTPRLPLPVELAGRPAVRSVNPTLALPAPQLSSSLPVSPALSSSNPGAGMEISVAAPELASRPSAAPPSSKRSGRTVRDVFGPNQRKLVVAIDAGHGGKDPGAHGPSGVREKNITLAVARELARQINVDPGMRAVLIRDGDSFVPLKERYMKARRAQADLFISIHADASPNNTANGASVFVLSTRGASSQAARWLADQENAADLVGGVSLDQKDHNLAAVLLDLSQSATMRASDDLANQVLGSLKNVGKAHKPAIERANFVVLRSPDVPSMLIETGFITNPDEEQRLNDAGYRNRLATAISDGVRRYFTSQPPAGSFYASRRDAMPGMGDSVDAPQLASSPD